MRHRPPLTLARLDLRAALTDYCQARDLVVVSVTRTGWYGVQIVFGRGQHYWPVRVQLKRYKSMRDPEAVQDVLYDRATHAIDRVLKKKLLDLKKS